MSESVLQPRDTAARSATGQGGRSHGLRHGGSDSVSSSRESQRDHAEIIHALAKAVDREKRLEDELSALREEVGRAGHLQRQLFRDECPVVAGLDVATLQEPLNATSGDLCGAERLDAKTVLFWIIDATGHDVAASVLATYAARILRGLARDRGSATFLPGEALASLNAELIRANLPNCEFVAATCAVYDESMRSLTWARGGAPYPLFVPHNSPARQLRSDGPLLGAVPDATFESTTVQLAPGDRLTFFSDGLEAFWAGSPDLCECLPTELRPAATRKPCAESAVSVKPDGCEPSGDGLSIAEGLGLLERALQTARQDGWHRDDVTVMALQATSPIEADPSVPGATIAVPEPAGA